MKKVMLCILLILCRMMLPAQGLDCGSAQEICPSDTPVFGNTTDAPVINPNPECDDADDAMGFPVISLSGAHWYQTTGDGGLITASTCHPNTNFDTQLFIYTGNCSSPTLFACDNDDPSCPNLSLLSEVSWNSTAGITYYIAVTGAFVNEGAYALTLSGGTCGSCLTDTIPPSFSTGCPADTFSCVANVGWILPVGEDNCNEILMSESHASGALFPEGKTTVRYILTDQSGNSNECSFDVHVDSLPPEIDCKDMAIMLDAYGEAAISSTDLLLSVSDDCIVDTMYQGMTNINCLAEGVLQVSFTATDAYGHVGTCISTISVSGIPHFETMDQEKLTASDGMASDRLGKSVSISYPWLISGAYLHDGSGSNSGAAYLYYHDGATWSEYSKIIASDGVDNDKFGVAVSIYDTIAVVGSMGDDDNGNGSGAAYIYHFNGTNWVEIQKLKPADGSAGDEFGRAVSVHKNRIIVSSMKDQPAGVESGSVYIFTYNGFTWNESQKLIASNAEAGARYGVSVAIHDSLAVVGADRSVGNGAVYVYHLNGGSWVEDTIFTDNGANNDFGFSVAADTDKILVGVPSKASIGVVKYYEKINGSWEEKQIFDHVNQEDIQFGWSVDMDDKYLAISALSYDSGAGSVYVYERTNGQWRGFRHLMDDNSVQAGNQVGFSYPYLASSSMFDDDQANDAGALYVLKAGTNCDWTCPDDFEPNDVLSLSAELPAEGIQGNARICYEGDQDWYVFNSDSFTHLKIRLMCMAENLELYLYNAGETLVAASNNANTEDELLIIDDVFPEKTYYINVKGAVGTERNLIPYCLKVNKSMQSYYAEEGSAEPEKMSVYPNPVRAGGRIHLKAGSYLRLMSVDGVLLYKGIVSEPAYRIPESLPAGLYIAEVLYGEEAQRIKLLVTK